MFKVSAKAVDFSLLKQYANNETVRIAKSGSHVIIEITANSEDSSDEWWEDSQRISQYIAFRDDLLAGDYRCLYIAWLAGYFAEDDEEEEEQKTPSGPPIPPGMKKLSSTLRSFIDFMYLDEKRLKTALKSTADSEPSTPTLKEIKDWVAQLPDKDWQKILVDLLQEKTAAQIVQRELRNRFLKERK